MQDVPTIFLPTEVIINNFHKLYECFIAHCTAHSVCQSLEEEEKKKKIVSLHVKSSLIYFTLAFPMQTIAYNGAVCNFGK